MIINVRFTDHPRWKNIKKAKRMTGWFKRMAAEWAAQDDAESGRRTDG